MSLCSSIICILAFFLLLLPFYFFFSLSSLYFYFFFVFIITDVVVFFHFLFSSSSFLLPLPLFPPLLFPLPLLHYHLFHHRPVFLLLLRLLLFPHFLLLSGYNQSSGRFNRSLDAEPRFAAADQTIRHPPTFFEVNIISILRCDRTSRFKDNKRDALKRSPLKHNALTYL